MKKSRRQVIIAICLPLALLAGILYYGITTVSASSCCPSESGKASGDHAGHAGQAKKVEAKPVSSPAGLSVDAKVVSVNRTDGTVSVILDLPLQDKSLNSLTEVKKGDSVRLTLVRDKAGKLVVAGVSTSSKTATLRITGIQCQACADRLQESLQTAPGVSSATVTANPSQAVIAYGSSKTSINALKDIIRKTEPIHPGMPFGVKD